MLRQLLFISLLLPMVTFAMSLGGLQTMSHLYQPVSARIVLNDLPKVPTDEIKVELASQLDFARNGMAKTNVVRELQFKLVHQPNQQPYIQITTGKPVNEPIVSFLLQVSWNKGEYIKKYILMLDPAPVTRPPKVRTEQESTVAPVQREINKMIDNIYGPTTTDESLWRVAHKVRPSKAVTINQTMLALTEYNPNAFLRHNVNGLMGGYYLRIPSIKQIQATTPAAANRQIMLHDKYWKQQRNVKLVMKAHAAPTKAEFLQAQAEAHKAAVTVSKTAPVKTLPLEAGPVLSSQVAPAPTYNAATPAQQTAAAINQDQLVSLRAELDAALKQNQLLKQNNAPLQAQLEQLMASNKTLQAQLTEAKATVERLQKLLNKKPTTVVKTVPAKQTLVDKLMRNWGLIGGLLVIILLIVWLIIHRRKDQVTDDLPPESELGDDSANEPVISMKTTATAPTKKVKTNKLQADKSLDDTNLDIEAHAEVEEPDNGVNVTQVKREKNDSTSLESVLPDMTVQEVRKPSVNMAESSDLQALLEEAKLYVDYGRAEQAKQLLETVITLPINSELDWEQVLRIICEIDDKMLFGKAVAKIPAELLSADDQALWQTVENLRGQLSVITAVSKTESTSDKTNPSALATAEVVDSGQNEATEETVIDADDEIKLSPLSAAETEQLQENAEAKLTKAKEHTDNGVGLSLKLTEDDDTELEIQHDSATEPAAADLLAGEDSDVSKLDLARAYIEMDDHDAAKKLLLEIKKYGKPHHKEQAEIMLKEL